MRGSVIFHTTISRWVVLRAYVGRRNTNLAIYNADDDRYEESIFTLDFPRQIYMEL